MNRRIVLWSSLGTVALLAGGFGVWMLTLPSAPEFRAAPAIARDEADATLVALKPPKRVRPLIAVVGINDGTELTDYLVPLGILRRSGVADVVALATKSGPVTLFPAALAVEPD